MRIFAFLVAKISKYTGLGSAQVHLLIVIGAGIAAGIAVIGLAGVLSRRPDRRMRDDARLHRAIARCFEEPDKEPGAREPANALSQSSAEQRALREDEAYRRWLN